MVLAELGSKITNAIRQMNSEPVIDEAVVDSLLKEIGNALVLADVNVPMVAKLKMNIKKRVSLEEIASGLNKRKIIKQVRISPRSYFLFIFIILYKMFII